MEIHGQDTNPRDPHVTSGSRKFASIIPSFSRLARSSRIASLSNNPGRWPESQRIPAAPGPDSEAAKAQQRVAPQETCRHSTRPFHGRCSRPSPPLRTNRGSPHPLTVQNPAEVWFAILRTAWRPRAGDGVQIHFVRYFGKGLTAGIESHLVEAVQVPVTSVARTVADCFKCRNKIGRDVALEALQEGWRQKRYTMDELWRYAELCRVTKVMLPHLETLLP